MSNAASGRLVRAFVRYLRERVGAAAFDPVAAQAGLSGDALPSRADWIALDVWQPLLAALEGRFGDVETWRLVREATRSTMAVAISKGWSAFLADVTPDQLLDRADTFWKMSYNAGTLVVVERHPRHVVLAIDGWVAPAPVGAMVAEACAVFLARLGERAPRAIERAGADGRVEIDVRW